MPDLVLAHSSDLHIGFFTRNDSLDPLRSVLATAAEVRADIVLLVGDIFDNNRVPDALVSTAARIIASSGLDVIFLPGNHDPLTADSVYYRAALAGIPGVFILGQGAPARDEVVFPVLDLEIWGRAHRDYEDMQPLSQPPRRSHRWQILLAHGHVIEREADPEPRSWQIRPVDVAATGADYVALGHWDRAARVEGCGDVPAYYSGSPQTAGTINVVRLADEGGVHVRRQPLART